MKKIAIYIIALTIAFSFAMPNFVMNKSVKAEELKIYLTDDESVALKLLNEIKSEYDFDNPTQEFLLENSLEVAYGKVYRLVQIKDGVRVYGRGINITADKKGNLLSVNSAYLKIDRLRPEKVSESEAKYKAEKFIGSEAKSIEKIIYSLDEIEKYPTYAYYITLSGANVIVSAYDGNILLNESNEMGISVKTTQTDFFGNSVDTYVEQTKDTYELADYTRNIFTVDMKNGVTISYNPISSSNGTFTDKIAVSAFNNVVKAYDYYTNKDNLGVSLRGINGKNDETWGNYNLDNEEIALYVLVHYDKDYGNASYSYNTDKTSVLRVGDGAGSGRGRIDHPGAAIDVMAHEYQHGITSYLAGLEYHNDAGAIDEATSDIFGMIIEDYELSDERFWFIGEDSVKSGYEYIRNTISPDNLSKINYVNRTPACNKLHNHSTANNGECDYGGVHDNSTILTHMQYNMYKDMPDFFTKRIIGKLWYTTLTKLSYKSTFAQFGECMISAAKELNFPAEVITVIEQNLFKSGITAGENTHVVTFVNPDGSIIDEFSVEHGGTVAEPVNPYFKNDSPNKINVLDKWSRSLENITQDETITATYKEADKKYTVRFYDGDDNLIKKYENVEYGQSVTPPSTATKTSDETYAYDFAGWDKKCDSVTEDMTITAQFTTVRNYKVTFVADGKVIDEQYVREGGSAISPKDPVKEDADKEYEFIGWSRSLDNITEDTVIYANFRESSDKLTVTFVSQDKEINSYKSKYDDEIVFPDEPEREGYIFDGWYYDKECKTKANKGDKVKSDLTLYAKWSNEKSGCACGTVNFGSNVIPPAMLILKLSALTILIPKRKKKNKINKSV